MYIPNNFRRGGLLVQEYHSITRRGLEHESIIAIVFGIVGVVGLIISLLIAFKTLRSQERNENRMLKFEARWKNQRRRWVGWLWRESANSEPATQRKQKAKLNAKPKERPCLPRWNITPRSALPQREDQLGVVWFLNINLWIRYLGRLLSPR